jgi:hypothetical protein
MSDGIGRQLRAAAVYLVIFAFLLVAFTGVAAGKASARASLRGYLTASPGTWQPQGFNVTGTAVNFVIGQLGWDVIKTFGNVGIGDGSVRALNLSSNINDINYTEENYMAGDVTAAPWDPTRIKDFSVQEVEAPEHDNTTSKNISEAEVKTEHENNNSAQVRLGEIGGNIALNDPFHSILFGRPVGDLLYEHPPRDTK